MTSPERHFDLALAYPQWQGSGRHENLPRGALAAASVCAQLAPSVAVPLSENDSDAYGVCRWGAIFEQFQSAQAILAERRPQRVLASGGDCAVDVAVIDYLNALHPKLQVLWVDAHLDANTPETSPSGSFHGMPVAALFGYPPEPMLPLLGTPLDSAQFRYFGIQIGDQGDWAFQRAQSLQTFAQGDVLHGPVHIHFDLDVLDPVEFPHLAYTDGKLTVEDAVALVREVAQQSDLVGFTVTEFSPADADAAQSGSVVIERLCKAAAGQ